jgi:hydroxymethylglutaryl-CoA lyase
MLETVRGAVPVSMTALHFHDTRGTGLANVLMALAKGVTTFDSSAGGLGGCPFAPGAAGNLATEDLVYMLDGLGVRSGIDLARLVSASMFIESRLDHELPSKVYRAERRKPMG